MNHILPDPDAFRTFLDEKKTDLFILQNQNHIQVAITNYGARLVSILVPDKSGSLVDITWGYDNIQDYLAVKNNFFGCVIGRYCNRIAKGKFQLEGKTYQLKINNAPNSLHGGEDGFHTKVWDVEAVDSQQIKFSYTSPDGEEGFPGTLKVKLTYTLTADNELRMDYEAVTDQTTVIALTNHAFFNLNGQGTITNHQLNIFSDEYLPIDEYSIPLGNASSVENTPFDFRQPKTIGRDIDTKDEQLINGKGYDHNFILKQGNGLNIAARVTSPDSGIGLEVLTTEPGIQFYSGNFLTGADRGKNGVTYSRRSAFCLEAQHYPDSPNNPHFPSTILHPEELYKASTVYKFVQNNA